MTRGIERLTIYCLGTVAWSHCDFLLPLFLFETSTTHPRTRAPEEKIYSWRNPLRECKRCIRYVERIHRGFRGFQNIKLALGWHMRVEHPRLSVPD